MIRCRCWWVKWHMSFRKATICLVEVQRAVMAAFKIKRFLNQSIFLPFYFSNTSTEAIQNNKKHINIKIVPHGKSAYSLPLNKSPFVLFGSLNIFCVFEFIQAEIFHFLSTHYITHLLLLFFKKRSLSQMKNNNNKIVSGLTNFQIFYNYMKFLSLVKTK